jgi:hypothetical protein
MSHFRRVQFMLPDIATLLLLRACGIYNGRWKSGASRMTDDDALSQTSLIRQRKEKDDDDICCRLLHK